MEVSYVGAGGRMASPGGGRWVVGELQGVRQVIGKLRGCWASGWQVVGEVGRCVESHRGRLCPNSFGAPKLLQNDLGPPKQECFRFGAFWLSRIWLFSDPPKSALSQFLLICTTLAVTPPPNVCKVLKAILTLEDSIPSCIPGL